MDIPDDPSTTTTNTTDYDSGDSAGIDYVYEGQLSAERATSKPRSHRRTRSHHAKPLRCRKCAHAASYAEDDAEFTVFEEDADTEDERQQHRRRPSGLATCFCHGERGHRKHEKKTAETKTTARMRSPYVEEYPELMPRPLIILREHKIFGRRPSVSDAKCLRDSEERSLSGSRGRSPAAKRPPPRPSRLASKETPKHSKHRKHHLDPHEYRKDHRAGSETRNPRSGSGEPKLTTRRRNREAHPEMPTAVARSSAWDDAPEPQYSSSWPLQKGAHLARARPKRHEPVDSTESESESEEVLDDDSNFENNHRLVRTRAPSFREHVPERRVERRHETRGRETPSPERGVERYHETRRRETSPPVREREHEHERDRDREHEHRAAPSRPRPRPKTIVGRASMATIDQGYRSVATSLCDVWQGESGQWESPYDSPSEDDLDSGVDEPIGLLRMPDDLPARRSSPRLLPPRGGREDFGFQAKHHLPLEHTYRPSIYLEEPVYTDLWPSPLRTGRLLLEAPPAPPPDPDAMADPEDMPGPPCRALQPARPRHSLNNPHPPPPPPPRSRAVSPVFSARKTREFLSPRPTRAAARFDFGAWGCGRGSASSISLGWV